MCNCKNKEKNVNVVPPLTASPVAKPTHEQPVRSGACPYCLRKHLLKARGYAAEVREDGTREWERENLLENLLLAEDHAEALGDTSFKAAIRGARLIVEDGGLPDMEPLLARAREKILGLRSVDGVGEVLKETTPAPTKTEN